MATTMNGFVSLKGANGGAVEVRVCDVCAYLSAPVPEGQPAVTSIFFTGSPVVVQVEMDVDTLTQRLIAAQITVH